MTRLPAWGVAACLIVLPTVVSGQTVSEVMAQFENEPSILEVQEATMAYNHIDQSQMRSWMRRANAANVLPDVYVQYDIREEDDQQDDTDRDFAVDPAGNEVLTDVARDQRIENDDQTTLRIRGDWNLPDLIWNDDVLDISDERTELVELRQDLLTNVTSQYYQRRRAQVQLILDPPSDAVERLRRELELQELTAGIDALTGGWYGDQLSAAGLPTY